MGGVPGVWMPSRWGCAPCAIARRTVFPCAAVDLDVACLLYIRLGIARGRKGLLLRDDSAARSMSCDEALCTHRM